MLSWLLVMSCLGVVFFLICRVVIVGMVIVSLVWVRVILGLVLGLME